MDPLTLARWQFAITTIFHFIFVPLTIGLGLLVAVMQTHWYRTRDDRYRRMTRFWGKLFLINFAMGVVTGIVQEFQFGMNWSSYSRYVGDIFGAPLAVEALLAFFLESTFIGVWIFGWDRLSPKLHLASIWLASIATMLSAYVILAANSWMQHPVGYVVNQTTGRAELKDFFAVVFNSTALLAFPHVLVASFLTTGMFILGISGWHLLRNHEVDVFRPSAAIALVVAFVASVAVAFSGHAQAQLMTRQQPMKMAAAEALWETKTGAEFSLFAVGDVADGKNHLNLAIPKALSVLATNDPNGTVKGINDLNAAYQQQYGPGDYRPPVAVSYWSFRVMAGIGFALALLTLIGLVQLRRGRFAEMRWFHKVALFAIAAPYLGNITGWIFSEVGRQPWAVFGLLRTGDSVSPIVGAGAVLTTMIGFSLLYGVLAVVWFWLTARYAKAGPIEVSEEAELHAAMAY